MDGMEVFEAVGVEENSGLESSSCQNLCKSDCNGLERNDQASDPDNSYVFVDMADGLGDDLVDNMNVIAVDASIHLETKVPAEFVEVEFDALSQKIDFSLKEETHASVEGCGWIPACNLNNVEYRTNKLESLEVVKTQKVNDQNEKTEIAVEAENRKDGEQTISESSFGLEQDQESSMPDAGLVAESDKRGKLICIPHLNECIKTHDSCDAEVSSGSTEAPQLMVEGAHENKLHGLVENEMKSLKELSEVLEPEALLTSSINLDLQLQLMKNIKDTVEDAESALSAEIIVDQNLDPSPKNSMHYVLDKDKRSVSNTGCCIETLYDQIVEGKPTDLSLSCVEDHLNNAEIRSEHSYYNKVSHNIMNSDSETEVTVAFQTFSDTGTVVHEPWNEVKHCGSGVEVHDSSFVTEVAVANSEVSHCRHASTDVKLESAFHKSNDTKSIEVLDSFSADKEDASNVILESVDVKVVGCQLGGSTECSAGTWLLQRNDEFGNAYEDLSSKSSSEISEDVGVDALIKTFNFLVKIPLFNDEDLREQIRDAKLEVDEKTKIRGAVKAQIQEKRANSKIHSIDYEYSKDEDVALRKLIKFKRMEIDSLHTVVNRAKNAIIIEEMDNRINSMEHVIQHETLPLREEKQLVREIRQLKQLREQLSSNMGSQNEIQEALEQRDEAEERLKILKKELVNLKDRFLKAQTATMEAANRYNDENKKVRELKDHFRAADSIRQAAFAKCLSLQKLFWEKNKYFSKYKDDEAAAKNYASVRNGDGLYHLCMNQVEKFMELWNGNAEFRMDYISFNTRSTVIRFGTLDGRSLGPDEKSHVLPNHVTKERNERVTCLPENADCQKQSPSLEPKQKIPVENPTSDVRSQKKVDECQNQTVKFELGNNFYAVSGWHLSDEMTQEDCLKTGEQIELERKAEEIRREEAEAKRKEDFRLEQLTKAREAREKKKRHDEKVQMREESRARKEAELKEKERVRRMRKKERKMAAIVNESSESSESTVEICKEEDQISDISSFATCKKPRNSSTANRQNKMKSVPPHIRNRNRKKWQQWMWVSLACLVIVLLFWLGNMGLFANLPLKRRDLAF